MSDRHDTLRSDSDCRASLSRRRLVVIWLLCHWIFLVLSLDIAWAMIGGWRPISRITAAIMYLALAAPLLSFAWLFGRRGGRWFSKYGLKIAMAINAALLSLLAADIALRFVVNSAEAAHLKVANARYVFHPPPGLLPGVTGPSVFSTNSRGLRGAGPLEAGSAVRVLCVGGSTTECLYLDDTEAWPARLQEILNQSYLPTRFCVEGAGVSGASSTAHREFLQQSQIAKDVDCVIVMAGINDLRLAIGAQRRDAAPPLFAQSRLWLLARSLRRKFIEDERAQDPAGDFYVTNRKRCAEARTLQAAPDVSSGIELFRENLNVICDLCERRKIRLILVTQPVLWSSGLDKSAMGRLWMTRITAGDKIAVEAARELLERFNDVTRQVAIAHAVTLVDLAPMSGVPDYFYDDCHFSEVGAEEVARRIAAAWQSRNTPQ